MKITCLSRSESPITHQLGVIGNESVVNVEDVRTELGVVKVPVLSGNAIRHRMIRAPAAEYLIESLDLSGHLSRDTLNLLFHGGLKRQKAKRPSLARIATMHRLLPVFRLLGCCLPEAIVSGELIAYRAMLVCRENANRIESFMPFGWCEGSDFLAPATSFVERWQYVRGKLTHAMAESATDETDEDDSKMMPFAGSCVIPGSMWVHGFYLRKSRLVDVGCLLHSLLLWDASCASIGGQSSRGHGVLSMAMHIDDDINQDEAVAAYEKHVLDNANECREFLLECYA